MTQTNFCFSSNYIVFPNSVTLYDSSKTIYCILTVTVKASLLSSFKVERLKKALQDTSFICTGLGMTEKLSIASFLNQLPFWVKISLA